METIKGKKAAIIGMAFSMVLLLSILGICRKVYADPAIPEASAENTKSSLNKTWTLTESTTIKLSSVSFSNPSAGPVISIQNNAIVNLVFEGNNELRVLDECNDACIEVKSGSTLNIFGLEGASLTVYAGQSYNSNENKNGNFGAGIGSAGSNNHTVNIPGTINIKCGTITAYGGIGGGAGIGSGRGSSGGTINITGGTVTAYGQGSGAGIGSGYCTSGGDNGHKSGTFNGGSINITGGVVKAAAGRIDSFTGINASNPNTYNNCNNFGAGIGGGYGSTSGTIVIGGNAVVTAVGFGGGAGIGAGRGTSDKNKYESSCTPYNITIQGNATVNAYAGKDIRDLGTKSMSGAGIGGGRGFGAAGETSDATIIIKDSADVSAQAGAYAQSIGVSAASVSFKDTDDISTVAFPTSDPVITTQGVVTGHIGTETDTRIEQLAGFTGTATVSPPASTGSGNYQLKNTNGSASVPTWTRGSNVFTFTIDGNDAYNQFKDLYLGTTKLTNGTDYTTAPGSVKITVKEAALKNLSNGNYNFKVEFKDGSIVNVPFTVKSPSYDHSYDDDDDDDNSGVSSTVTLAGDKKKAPKTGER